MLGAQEHQPPHIGPVAFGIRHPDTERLPTWTFAPARGKIQLLPTVGPRVPGGLTRTSMRYTFSIPEGWTASESRFDDLRQEVLCVASPDWRASPDHPGRGDASSPMIAVTRSAYPAAPDADDLFVVMEGVRATPGFRLVSSGRSVLPHGHVVTYAAERPRFPLRPGDGTFECVERVHFFVAGGRRFHVIASADAGEWEDGGLLRLVEAIEANVSRENA